MLDIVHLGEGHTDYEYEVFALGLITLGQGLFGQFPSHQRSLALAQEIRQDQAEGSLLLTRCLSWSPAIPFSTDLEVGKVVKD